MDEVTFRSDTVLSDVHLYTPNQRHLMVRLNSMGQPVFLSRFKLLWNQDSWADSGVEAGSLRAVRAEETPPAGTGSLGSPPGSGHSGDGAGAQLDEDGDLDVVRRPRAASDLEPAGPSRDKVHPVILTQEEDDLLGDEAQESSPHDVIKIDVGADLLTMCQRNIALNSHLTAAGAPGLTRPSCPPRRVQRTFQRRKPDPFWGGVVKVKELDWLKDDLCTDPKVPFSWSEEDVSDLYSHTTILLAAEVFYDDDLTDALFKTLFRLTRKLKNACIAILSVEKRLNFTLRDLDVTCEAYDHFRSALRRLEKLADGRRRFVVEPVDASFPTVPRL
nr:methyltransferase-like protein 22 isoform X7 [Equus asinus]